MLYTDICIAVETLVSGSGSDFETPTTAPTVTTNSGSGSLNNQTTPIPVEMTDTPVVTSIPSSGSGSSKETTTKPMTTAPKPLGSPPKPSPKPKLAHPMQDTPNPTVKHANDTNNAPIAQANSNRSDGNDTHPNNQMPMIIGVAGGAFVMVAAVMFFIWKRRRDVDDESDDEGGYRYDPPKPAYNTPALAKSNSTTSKTSLLASTKSQSFTGESARPTNSKPQYADASSFDESRRLLQFDDFTSSRSMEHELTSHEDFTSEWDTAEFGNSSFTQRRTSSNASVEF